MLYIHFLLSRKVAIETVRSFAFSDVVTLHCCISKSFGRK